ncbi:MAG TPA: hypothetical protein VGQ36_22590 [Thermoanaerobaculia bacterium]|jgi:hypothetical protein|nr:hypothetical protein [Thermoanaerobaculia bacterium]
MHKFIVLPLLLLVALNAFGHAGEVHKYMGTITALHDDGSFMLQKTDGKTIHVAVKKTTVYRHADGRVATRAELATGKRAVVTVSKDGKTASEVKFAAAKK